METYIKVYDWMSSIRPTDDRLVYALIYQLTKSSGGFWSTMKVMSDRLGIPKKVCKEAIARLEQMGAVYEIRQTVLHKDRRIYYAEEHFAELLQDD